MNLIQLLAQVAAAGTNDPLSLPATWLVFPAIVGALAITVIQAKKGEAPVKSAAKVLLAFGFGFFGGHTIQSKTGLDSIGACFAGALFAPVIMSCGEAWIKMKFKVTSKGDSNEPNQSSD